MNQHIFARACGVRSTVDSVARAPQTERLSERDNADRNERTVLRLQVGYEHVIKLDSMSQHLHAAAFH